MRIALLTGVLVAALLLAGGLVARGTPPRTGVPAIELRAETARPGQPQRPRERATQRRREAGAGSSGPPRSSGAIPAPAPAPAPVGDDADDDADDDDDRSDDAGDD